MRGVWDNCYIKKDEDKKRVIQTVRNVPLKSVDSLDRDVIALGTDYLPNTLLETHQHRRAQFLYPATGLIEVSTDEGEWVIPPSCGVWIPPETGHETRMLEVSTRSLYIEPSAALVIANNVKLSVFPLFFVNFYLKL
ncbi:putative transcriptional regulator [Proteus vulgaris]|nr:putative transcriptional regulator [Proteus vulgaris]